MDSDVTAGVVVILFTLAFVTLAIVLGQQRKCVTCGEFHKSDDEILRCCICHRPFCKQNAAYMEDNKLESVGKVSTVRMNTVTKIPAQSGRECGLVYQLIVNGQPGESVSYCKKHSNQ